MKLLNPEVKFKVYREFLNHENAIEIIREFDVVVDGTDNFNSRYLINDVAVMLGKPVVFGSILGFEGQVSVFNWGEKGPTYRCVFPEAPDPLNSPSCSELGVIGILPGMIGSFQANEVIKICTGIGQPLSGKLLIYNALTNGQITLSVSQIPENKKVQNLDATNFVCNSPSNGLEVSIEEFLQDEDYWKEKIIDLRSKGEFHQFNRGGRNLPLQKLAIQFKELEKGREILLVCQSGQRSQKAMEFLMDNGYKNVKHLKGGLQGLEDN
ncbi:HesA/MoeB/ThiF family protein [Echinicola jeungdonensis]|nr:HesA/MoeB/ThiF family protein [Echinicola jeungdonensis]MDN3670859.1 HesA/MoeB/ThiF family protein [Echinicola jeungdonensis]